MSKKLYAVKVGRCGSGIFNTWAECEALLRAGKIKDGLTALALMYGRWLLGEGAAPTEPRS